MSSSGIAERPAPFFIADSSAIDFLNSRAQPTGSPVEWLADGQDLVDWLQRAGLVDAQTTQRLRESALPGELDGVAAQARELREWFREFVERHHGSALREDALPELAPLNALLERDDAYRVVQARTPEAEDGQAFQYALRRRWRSPATLLQPIADAMAQAICTADFAQVKHCEGPTCTLMFLDKTKGHARRWCSMAACGNRAKQAAHRERLRRSQA